MLASWLHAFFYAQNSNTSPLALLKRPTSKQNNITKRFMYSNRSIRHRASFLTKKYKENQLGIALNK